MPDLTEFDIERSALNLHIGYRGRSWMLNDKSPLYEALLERLSSLGASPYTIRTDTGDGSLGGYSLGISTLNYAVHLRLGLTGAELRCDDLSRVTLDQLEQVFVRLTEALVAIDESLTFASFSVNVELHGQPQGVEVKDYLATFVNAPEKDELGPPLGSGAVFYFGEHSPVTLSNVSVDFSGVLEGKLYFRAINVLDGGALEPSGVRDVAIERLKVGLEAVGLKADLE